MPDVTIGGNLPVGDANGLAALASDLVAEPSKLHVMIAVIDTQKVTRKTDTGERVATVRIRRIESILPGDLAEAEKLMRRSLEHRTGQPVLPLDLEDEVAAAFAAIDLDEAEAAAKADPQADDPGEDPGDDGPPPQDPPRRPRRPRK